MALLPTYRLLKSHCWVVSAFLLATAPAAWGQDSWEVVVDCPALSEEQRAELEVRHLVELESLQASPATLVIRCTETTVSGSWKRGREVLSERSVTRAPGDDVVELGHGIATILIGILENHPTGDKSPNTAVAQSSVVTQLGPSGAAGGEESLQQTSSPGDSDVGRQERAITASSVHQQSSPPQPPARQRSKWSTGLGMSGYYFGQEIPVALGPAIEGDWFLLKNVRVGASLTGVWGLNEEEGFGVFVVTPALHVDVAVVPWMGVTLGPVLSVLAIDKTGATEVQRAVAATPGLELKLRARAPQLGPGFFGGLDLQVLAHSREVREGGRHVITVPQWLAGVTLGVRFGG